MVQINFARREVQCKLVYYGPGMSGKTTNLEQIHELAPEKMKGNMTTIATDEDRTLFFDFMPLDLGTIAGLRTKFQMYTVPGQVYYDSVRKLVLEGCDGVVFVADSGPDRMDDNIESLKNLEENLKGNGIDLQSLPWVMQYNKRDLPGAIPVEDLQAKLNPKGVPHFEAVAFKGEGVMKTLKALSQLVIEKLNKDYGRRDDSSPAAAAPPAAAPTPEAKKEAPRPAAAVPAAAASAPATAGATATASPPQAQPPKTAAPGPVAAPPPRKPASPTPAPIKLPQKEAKKKGCGASVLLFLGTVAAALFYLLG